MRRHHFSLLLLVGLCCVAIVGCGESKEQPGSGPALTAGPPGPARALTGDLEALVPADALAFVRVSSLAEVQGAVDRMTDAVAPEAEGHTKVAEMLLEKAGASTEVDVNLPCAVAVTTPGPALDPALVYILPMKDAAAELSSARDEGDDVRTISRGSYVAFTADPDYTPGDGACRLTRNLPPGLVATRVDLARGVRRFRPQIDAAFNMLTEIQTDVAEHGAAVGSIKPVLAWMRALIDEADFVEVALNAPGTRVSLASAFQLKEKRVKRAEAEKVVEPDSKTLAQLAAALPQEHPATMLLSVDFQAVIDLFMPFYEDLARSMAPEHGEGFLRLLRSSTDLMPLLGSNVAMSFDLGEQGLELVEVFAARDPDGYVDRYVELLKDPSLSAMGFLARPAPSVKVSDRTVRRLLVDMDLKKLLEFMGQAPPLTPKEVEQFKAVMDRIFGSEPMQINICPLEDTVVVVMGSDDLLSRTLTRVNEGHGTITPSVGAALERMGDDPGFVGSCDLRGLLAGIGAMLKAEDVDWPQVPEGDPVAVVATGSFDGKTVHAAFEADVAAVARLIEAMMQ